MNTYNIKFNQINIQTMENYDKKLNMSTKLSP